MRKDKKITVLSTFAEDILIDETGRIIRKQKGGPAFYLTKAFKERGISVNLVTAPSMKVEILIKGGEEYGRIKKKPKPQEIDFSSIKTPYLLISTILDEFDLKGISAFRGKVFLDVQGYVRNGQDFGKKKYWKVPKEVAESIFCLKGTEKEMRYLPTPFLKSQKQKVLLITKGKSSCDVYAFRKMKSFKPSRIVKGVDTIGAGDYLFADFLINFLKTQNPFISAKIAVENTTKFLSSKIKTYASK
jgi:hypothetical protein